MLRGTCKSKAGGRHFRGCVSARFEGLRRVELSANIRVKVVGKLGKGAHGVAPDLKTVAGVAKWQTHRT